jgi:hypothetical protein
MSTVNLVKGDIVLTRKGHRRLWDGRHWRVLCRISNCPAQRQGSLDNKFGLCKRHFTQQISSVNHEQYKSISDEEKLKTSKRRKLNIIIDQLRYSQTISQSISIEENECTVISP